MRRGIYHIEKQKRNEEPDDRAKLEKVRRLHGSILRIFRESCTSEVTRQSILAYRFYYTLKSGNTTL
jgi:hypothetical protein